MFENLSDRLQNAIKNIKGYGKITEENIDSMVREVRLALLEADVNYKVVKEFTSVVREKALGEEVKKSLTPGEMFVGIIRDSLVELLGGVNTPLNLNGNPACLMLVGLQGSGKTTTIGKLADLLRKKHNKKPLLVACDIYRPAAIEQLKQIGKELNIPVYSENSKDAVSIAKNGVCYAKENGYDYVLIDTNLDSDTIDYLFERVNKPIICDAVSTIKADKLRNHLDKIYILKVNENEYSHLESDLNENIPTNLIITNGSKPVIYITKTFTKQYQPKQKKDIKSTTGAGDSFVAGVISGILDGLQIEDGIKRGLDFSYQTLDVTGAVNPNIKKG